MITFNKKEALKITICFENIQQYDDFKKFLKKKKIIPLDFNPDNDIKGKSYTGYYSNGNALIIQVWIDENKGMRDQNIFI